MTKYKPIATMFIILGIFAVAVVTIVLMSSLTGYDQEAARQTNIPCSSTAAPCIEIQDTGDHIIARVNDFRVPTEEPGCIYYRVSIGDEWQKHCGGYNMLWIEPNNP